MTLRSEVDRVNIHRHRIQNRAERAIRAAGCNLYTFPLARTRLAVYQVFNITWDPSCVPFPAEVDLYMSVVTANEGLSAVHVWKNVNFAGGVLATQLQPAWWNASSGAGSISAQFGFTASGSPLWDTIAPSGPDFFVNYNGSYGFINASAEPPQRTGPTVEVVGQTSGANSNALTGARLGVAIALPLLALTTLLGCYLTWNKLRKKPEKKRWSAVIDKRMSMMSQGTWQPSASISSRPASHYHERRPSEASYQNLETRRHSVSFQPRAGSLHSIVSSPLTRASASVPDPFLSRITDISGPVLPKSLLTESRFGQIDPPPAVVAPGSASPLATRKLCPALIEAAIAGIDNRTSPEPLSAPDALDCRSSLVDVPQSSSPSTSLPFSRAATTSATVRKASRQLASVSKSLLHSLSSKPQLFSRMAGSAGASDRPEKIPSSSPMKETSVDPYAVFDSPGGHPSQ